MLDRTEAMYPLTIGGVVSVLAGRSPNRGRQVVSDEVGWPLAGQIVNWVRYWLADIDEQAVSLLEWLVTSPCPEYERALAQRIDHYLNVTSPIGRDLTELVKRAKADDVLGPVLELAAEELAQPTNGSDEGLFPPKADPGYEPSNGSDSSLFAAEEAPEWPRSDLEDLFPPRSEKD